MSAEIRGWLAGELSTIFAPRSEESTTDWAERTIRLRSEESPGHSGPFRSRLTPYTRLLLEFPRNEQWDEFVGVKSSQAGFTLAALIGIVEIVARRPANIIYVIDAMDKAREISKVRLQGMLRDCGETTGVLAANDDDVTNLSLYLPRKGMLISLVGSGNAGQLATRPAKFLYADEVDKYVSIRGEGNPLDLLRSRKKTAGIDAKVIAFSSPTTEHGTIWTEYLKGSQHRFFVPCPHCEEMQTLEWERMRFAHCRGIIAEDELAVWDTAELLRSTYYECKAGCRIEMAERGQMVQRGEWRQTNWALDRRQRVLSCQISDLYSPFVTWGQLAEEYVSGLGHLDKEQDFQHNRLGLPHVAKTSSVSVQDVARLKSVYKRRGILPETPVAVTMQADTQDDRFKWVISAWTARGDQYVWDYGESIAIEHLEVEARDAVVNGVGWKYGVIDEGGHRDKEVREFVATRPRWTATKGMDGTRLRQTVGYGMPVMINGIEIRTLHYHSETFRTDLYQGKIAEHDPDRDRARLHFPLDAEAEFLQEFRQRRRVREKDRYGQEKLHWRKFGADDWADCVMLGFVIWHEIGPIYVAAASGQREKARLTPAA